MKASIPDYIFREYDIRGIVGQDLNTHVAEQLGKAVGTLVQQKQAKRLIVSRDCRASGEELSQALINGLNSTGCDVINIGVVSTPVNYWAIQKLTTDGGIQITGSHNPPEYNGFKITLFGHSLHGEEIKAFYHIIQKQAFSTGVGKSKSQSILDDYVQDLHSLLSQTRRKLRVVVDAGNGTGGITAIPLYKKLGHEVIPLFCDMDGRFPNHHPDPTVDKNLCALQNAVATHQADIGIAFDGDADRIGVVDRDGEIIRGDRLLILLAREVLKYKPGASIIGEVKCSKTLYDDINKRGGKAIMWRTGHSLIKSKMKEVQAELAGEMSGHIFFKHRFYGFDDAVYAGGRLLEILSDGTLSIEERLADIPNMISTPEIRLPCQEDIKFELVSALIEHFKNLSLNAAFSVKDTDGARLEWSDGWGLVRTSNTQPILVLRFEAQNESRLHEIRKFMEDTISEVKAQLSHS